MVLCEISALFATQGTFISNHAGGVPRAHGVAKRMHGKSA